IAAKEDHAAGRDMLDQGARGVVDLGSGQADEQQLSDLLCEGKRVETV
nr:hypothetical protein [Pyrinomonadaceae bacterium]